MRRARIAGLVLALAAPVAVAAELPPEESIQPVEVVRTGDYSEGVVVDHDGNIYFSHEKIITKVTPDGKAATWAVTGAPNGHKILADGTHLVCDGSRHGVLHLGPEGRILEFSSKECDGKPLRAPNDLTLDPKGGYYFTDPADSDERHRTGAVYYVDPKGVTHEVAHGLAFPNGIVLRPDGKELLVGESKENHILAYPVEAPGKVGKSRVFAKLPEKGKGQIDNQPDGIALDAEGNLYVAHYGMREVQVIDPHGKVIRHYPGGNLTTSNVAFGGPKLDQLYVTGGDPGSLFRLDLGVKGLAILPARSASEKGKSQ